MKSFRIFARIISSKAAVEYGLIVYNSREELLADPEIEIVLVATTNEAHKDNCIAALAAGKHVICEKPVTMSSDELREVMEAAGPTKTMAPRNLESTETIELSMPQGITDSLSKSYDQLTAAIEGKAPLAITAEQAIRVMLVMEAAFKSSETKKAIDVEI